MTIARDGGEALCLAAAVKPELVLLDLVLPDIDGFDLARLLRSLPEVRHVRIISLSGMNPKAERLAEAGIYRHLLKPVPFPDLLAVIASEESNVSRD